MSSTAPVFVCHCVNVTDEAERQASVALLPVSCPAATQTLRWRPSRAAGGSAFHITDELQELEELSNKSHVIGISSLVLICSRAAGRDPAEP